jgi:hypothetical protein
MRTCEIEIGRPPAREGYNDNNGWGCSAIVNHTYPSCISENNVSFWCSLDKYGIDVKIGRQSPEGQKIERGIRNNISLLQMETLLLALTLPHITPHQFERIAEEIEREAFTRGKNAVRQSLSAVLEIEY